MGSPLIAGWIAHLAFWGLMLLGVLSGELRAKLTVVFLLLWSAAIFALPHLPYVAGLGTTCVAVLDIALVFIVFKGDVRLT